MSRNNTGYMPPSIGVRDATLKASMDGYDSLPKSVRRVIAEGEIKWATDNVKANMLRRKMRVADVVKHVREMNRKAYLATYPGIENHVD